MNVPSNINVPGSYVAISNVRAITGLSGEIFRTLFYGQMTSAGTATANQLVRVSSKEHAEELFGVGSILAIMFANYFANNQLNEIYAVPLADAAAASKATFTLTLAGAATAAGTLKLYIDGELIQSGVLVDDTAAEIATAITAEINAETTLPVVATVAAEVITLTAKNAGTVQGQTDVRFNYDDDDDEFPIGITLASSVAVAGATDPDLDDALAATPDKIYSLIVHPYQDTTNIGKVKTELDSRWLSTKQLEGHQLIAYSGTFSSVAAFGETFNDSHLTIFDAGLNRPAADYVQAAAVAGVAAGSLSDDPGLPLQTLTVVGISAETETNERLFTESNQFTDAGISTAKIDNGGNLVIERLVTTYLTNTSGARDKSYQNIQTMFISSYLRQTLIAYISSKYARCKLGADGGRYASSQKVATPKMIKGTILNWFIMLERAALVENYEQFKDEVSVLRDIDDGGTNPDRVNAILPTDYINQFRIFAGEIQFIV